MRATCGGEASRTFEYGVTSSNVATDQQCCRCEHARRERGLECRHWCGGAAPPAARGGGSSGAPTSIISSFRRRSAYTRKHHYDASLWRITMTHQKERVHPQTHIHQHVHTNARIFSIDLWHINIKIYIRGVYIQLYIHRSTRTYLSS